LLDEQFRPIPGFAGGQLDRHDGLDCPVRWAGHDLPELAVRTVRFAVRMQRTDQVSPRVYALNHIE